MSRFYLLVFTVCLALVGCPNPNSPGTATTNQKAMLNGELITNPLKWRVITCGANPNESTMSTVFGNDIAIQYSRRYAEGNYPAGSMLSLVTWWQQDDTRWFGARMPAETKSVELVTVGTSEIGQLSYAYQKYESSPLKRVAVVENQAGLRVAYILSQRAAVMP